MNLNILSLILILIKFILIYASNANVQANQSSTKGTTFDDDESGEELILTENELDHQRINKQMNQSSNSSCDHGWYSFEDQCYYFHEDMSGGTFYESLNICRHYHNSNLITITSKAQNDFLKNLLFNKLKLEYSIWLGLIRLNSTNFLWLNNANKQLFPVVKNNNQTWSSFTNWAPNEPNNFNSKHYCVVMSSEQSESLQGHWYDVTCNEAYLVICQRPSADSQNQSSIINNDSDIIKNFLYDHEEQITRRDEMKKLINLLEINIILWILLFVMILLWFCYHRFYRYYHHHDRSSFGHNQRFLMSRKHHKFHDNNGNLLQNQQPNDDTDNTDDELCSTSFIWNNNQRKFSRENSQISSAKLRQHHQQPNSPSSGPSIFDKFFSFGHDQQQPSSNNQNNHTTTSTGSSALLLSSSNAAATTNDSNKSTNRTQQQPQFPYPSLVPIPQQYPSIQFSNDHQNNNFVIETTDI